MSYACSLCKDWEKKNPASCFHSDIAETVGGKNRVSEIPNGRREFAVKMMRELHRKYNIPAESLLG